MEFQRIFTTGHLHSVCYPEHIENGRQVSIFDKILEQWRDTAYLRKFFIDNRHDLESDFWDGITVDEAIDQVLDEVEDFEDELWAVDTKQPGYEDRSLTAIFEPLHKGEYALRPKNFAQRKGKPDAPKPMLRLYGVELADGSIVITGGGIKLTEKMDKHLINELNNLRRVQEFLKSEQIVCKEGLTND
jgi:hypothetical protein